MLLSVSVRIQGVTRNRKRPWALVLLASGTLSCSEAPPSPSSATTLPMTSTSTTSTSTTIDLAFVRSEAAKLCREVVENARRPGLENELNEESIDFLVESAARTFADRDFGDPRIKEAAIASCRTAIRSYLTDLQATATTQPVVPVERAKTAGSADTETDDFTVTGTWRLSWDVSGGAGISVRIRTPDGALVDSVSIDPGSSSSQFRQGCTCYLEISTFGSSYEVVVTDLP